MPSPHPRVIAETRFTETLAEARKAKLEDFIQIERLGKEGFLAQFQPLAEDFLLLVDKLWACNPHSVPLSHLQPLENTLGKLLPLLHQTRNISPAGFEGLNGETVRNQIAGQINEFFQAVEKAAIPVIALSATGVSSEKMAAIEGDAQAALNDISDFRLQAEAAAQSAAKAAAETGVSAEAKYFEELSKAHQWSAKIWLVLTLVTAVVIIVLALWHFYNPYSITPDTKWIVIQNIAAKLVILSTLSFVLVFFLRNYNTSRHNHIVNEHRAKALATFKAFVAGADKDEETKHAVLLQACQAIYRHQTSGYLRKDGDPGGIAIFEWVKALTGK